MKRSGQQVEIIHKIVISLVVFCHIILFYFGKEGMCCCFVGVFCCFC